MVAASMDRLDVASEAYVGRWNHLVSTTNWEKGRIILAWREELQSSEAPAGEYSDDAWSRRVGGVSSQHVGRLRRVAERFGELREDYEGLYWSHFCAALDWDDAEMWLEGAVQSNWSVSQMRTQRWETLGAVEADKPRDGEVIASEPDEEEGSNGDAPGRGVIEPKLGVVRDPGGDDDAADEALEQSDEKRAQRAVASQANAAAAEEAEAPEAVRPFEDLPELPDDLAEALEAFKLAIVRHKLSHWDDVSPEDVTAALDALKLLVHAPAMA